MSVVEQPLTYRDQELLKAVAAGRVELTCGREPDVFVDGLAWCDQFGARTLIHAGLILGARQGRFGERVRALVANSNYEQCAR